MRPKYITNLWRVILALTGGLFMVFAAEHDDPWVVILDDYFFLNWLGAAGTAYLMLAVQHLTLRLTDMLCPFKVRSSSYYYRRGLVQFFVSFIPSLVIAIASAWLLVSVIGGVSLLETTYFNFDIYIVFGALVCLQFIQGAIHYLWTSNQFEEVSCWTTDGMVIYTKEEDWEEQLQRSLSYQRVTALLDAWKEEEVAEEEPVEYEVRGIIELKEAPKVLSKREIGYAKELERLDWRKTALFYADNKSNFVVDWQGHTTYWDTSLDFVTQHMDSDKYYRAAPHFIVHKALIDNVERAGNGQVRLLLKMNVAFDTRLSRLKSQEFRKWYRVKANSARVKVANQN